MDSSRSAMGAKTIRGKYFLTDVDGFDVQDYALGAVRCVIWQGFVLINLDRDCTPLESSHDSILSRFDDNEDRL